MPTTGLVPASTQPRRGPAWQLGRHRAPAPPGRQTMASASEIRCRRRPADGAMRCSAGGSRAARRESKAGGATRAQGCHGQVRARADDPSSPSYGEERHRSLSGCWGDPCLLWHGDHLRRYNGSGGARERYAAALNFAARSRSRSSRTGSGFRKMHGPVRHPVGIRCGRTAGGLRCAVTRHGRSNRPYRYFICAVRAHIRVRDRGIAGAVGFLAVAVVALTADLAYRDHW